MNRLRAKFVVLFVCGCVGILRADETAAEKQTRRAREFTEQIQPLLVKYCHTCHGDKKTEGDFSLVAAKSIDAIAQDRKRWKLLLAKVEAEAMPPEEATTKLAKVERTKLVQWLTSAVNEVDCNGSPNPGRVTLRRLNRREYRNTIRDLLGVDYEPAMDFPADDVGYGFDNIGDVLTLPPVLLEKYLDAAEQVVAKAIDPRGGQYAIDKIVPGTQLRGDGDKHGVLSRIITSNGAANAPFTILKAGEYEITVKATGDQAGPEPVKMAIRHAGTKLSEVEIKTNAAQSADFTAKVKLTPGEQAIEVAFLNDYYQPNDPKPENRDRNLIVNSIRLRGPMDVAPDLPAMHKQIIFAQPTSRTTRREATEQVLRRFATRAFRRPPTSDEVKRLSDLAQSVRRDGGTFEEGIQLAIQATLVSPHFLFKMELDPNAPADKARPLTDFELATRLSYFLWSTMPDDELLDLAAAKKLRDGDQLAKQIRRMLASPKSKALAENFAGQWLELRSLDIRTPDTKLFPAFNDELRRAMRTETETFFDHVVRENRPIIELLAADYAFVNEPLAKLYGLSGVTGPEFRRVALAGAPRGGLLMQASFLTITSNPTRTSPVKRGKWILENILGTPPPPAPPNVPPFEEKPTNAALTLRQRFEAHRSNPGCASCHQRMDPLGFAFENYDAIGTWRTMDGASPVDPAGELPTGEKIANAQGLRQLLIDKRRADFERCLTEKLLTYALGRGIEHEDQCAVDKILKDLPSVEHRLSGLLELVVRSEPFQQVGVRKPGTGSP